MEALNLDYMKSQRKSYTALYMNLIQNEDDLIKSNKKNVFFLEGKDDIKYYNSRFQAVHSTNFHFFPSGGKENVLKAQKFINLKYNGSLKIKFFVDRDFDTICTKDNLFVTPCYSIENLYISRNVFENILQSEFDLNRFSKSKDCFKIAYDLYLERKEEYLNCIEDLIIWCLHHHPKGAECDISKINDRLFSKKNPLVKFSLEKIEKNYDFTILESLTVNVRTLNEDEISKYRKILDEKSKVYFYRGKFLFQFFEKFMELFSKEANRKDNIIFSKRIPNSLSNSCENALSVFSQYSETPNCLKIFLSK